MNKKTVKVFGKKYYLLGRNSEGVNYYLQEPSWDCGWYWGLGYVETFTNNRNPEKSRDISSLGHFDTMFIKNYDSFLAMESPLSDNDKLELFELMKTAYTLKEFAQVFSRGGSNFLQNPIKKILLSYANKTNEVLLPAIFDKVREIMTKE